MSTSGPYSMADLLPECFCSYCHAEGLSISCGGILAGKRGNQLNDLLKNSNKYEKEQFIGCHLRLGVMSSFFEQYALTVFLFVIRQTGFVVRHP